MELLAILGILFGLVWLAGAIPFLLRSWNSAPKYYYIAKLIFPFLIFAAFFPRLFFHEFPASNPLLFGIYTLLLVYVAGAILFYLYHEPGDYTPRPTSIKGGILYLQTRDGRLIKAIDHSLDNSVLIRQAVDTDLEEAGKVFADVFSHTFDVSFGPNRKRNALFIAALLKLKLKELQVAVDSGEGVIGAIWIDLGDPATPKATPATVYPIARNYLNRWEAIYLSYLVIPALMAVRGDSEQGYIQWLGVAPQWQGHHVARKLIERAEELAVKDQKKTLALHTERSNKPARRLYEHFGFKENGFFRKSPRVFYEKALKSTEK